VSREMTQEERTQPFTVTIMTRIVMCLICLVVVTIGVLIGLIPTVFNISMPMTVGHGFADSGIFGWIGATIMTFGLIGFVAALTAPNTILIPKDDNQSKER
jgi:hypothetical protein